MKHTPGDSAMAIRIDIDDCWNRIGVQGDLSCTELVQHIHCRNCPVYSAAATALLDGELPEGYIDERSRQFAQAKQNHAHDHGHDHRHDLRSLAIFRIGQEWLALPTSVLDEVADLRPIHTLPHHKGGVVLGLVNVRGELLTCVSLGGLLGLELDAGQAVDPRQQLHTVYRRLLVMRGEGGRLVFPVDEMHGTHRFHAHELREVPVTVAKATATYATAMLPWQGHAVGCLDDQLVLYALNRSLA